MLFNVLYAHPRLELSIHRDIKLTSPYWGSGINFTLNKQIIVALHKVTATLSGSKNSLFSLY